FGKTARVRPVALFWLLGIFITAVCGVAVNNSFSYDFLFFAGMLVLVSALLFLNGWQLAAIHAVLALLSAHAAATLIFFVFPQLFPSFLDTFGAGIRTFPTA